MYSHPVSFNVHPPPLASLRLTFIAYSGTMDIFLAILPWKILWPLTMDKKEKFGMMFAMSMGVL